MYRQLRLPFKTFVGLLIVAFMLFPVYWTIVSSLETSQQIFAFPHPWFPPTPTLQGYADALRTQWPHIVTSLIVAASTVVLSLAIATPAAYALAQFRLRITAIFLFALLLTQMIPGVNLANALFVIFSGLHLLNSYGGLILADTTSSIPFAILVLRAFMQSIPSELTEAALVDGANEWRSFFSIILPISRSSIITAALFCFLFTWGDFLFALTLMSNNSAQPITLSIYMYVGQYGVQWNSLMAAAVLTSIPAAILLVVAQRHITAGLTSGSVKG